MRSVVRYRLEDSKIKFRIHVLASNILYIHHDEKPIFFLRNYPLLFSCVLIFFVFFVCFSRVRLRSCILCTMSSMEIRSSTSGYRIKDGEMKGRNAEVSILEGKIDFTNSACKESRVWHLKRRDGNFSIGLVDLRSFRHHRDSPPANSRPQFYQTSSTFTVQERKAFSGELTGGEVNQICAISNSRTTLLTTWKFAVFPCTKELKSRKNLHHKFIFQLCTLRLNGINERFLLN